MKDLLNNIQPADSQEPEYSQEQILHIEYDYLLASEQVLEEALQDRPDDKEYLQFLSNTQEELELFRENYPEIVAEYLFLKHKTTKEEIDFLTA